MIGNWPKTQTISGIADVHWWQIKQLRRGNTAAAIKSTSLPTCTMNTIQVTITFSKIKASSDLRVKERS